MATALLKKRLELRCTPDQREIIDRAVNLRGGSLTDFVLAAAQEKAMKLIQDFQSMKLNERESLLFAEALLNPSEPTHKLRKAAERYKAAF